MQSFYFSESQDTMILHMSCEIVFWTHMFADELIDIENIESQDPHAQICK